MPKSYFKFIFIFWFTFSNAQNSMILSGTVLDSNSKLPIELATVYLYNSQDSTVIQYTNTNKKGHFKINANKTDKAVFLKISCIGFQPYSYNQLGIFENKFFGELFLIQNTTELENVVINSEIPPIRIKKDTLEFNSSSFKVRPDSNIEMLLKKLPGFEVSNESKITVNGKEVTQFLVNGKSFFDKNGIIALKNLPAELISKIQVSDFKTKKEELSKQESSSENATINLIIDEKKNKGFFSKFLAGYGSDERYESSAVVNVFKKKQKISFVATSNNINATGFSKDEVFDNMGGGRNTNTRGGGFAGINSIGITQSNLAGINYSDEWFKNFDSTGSYSFSNTNTDNSNKSKQVNFLPAGSYSTESNSITSSENTDRKINFELEYKVNSTVKIHFIPKINQSNTIRNSYISNFSKNENESLLNENVSKSFRENNATNLNNVLTFNKTFKKKLRNLNLIFNTINSNTDSKGLSESKTIFYQEVKPNDERNQANKNINSSDSYSAEIEYTEPFTDSLRVRFGVDFDWQKEIKDVKTLDYDINLGTYTNLNPLLSNLIRSNQNKITPKLGFSFEKNNFTFNINSNVSYIAFNNHSEYRNNTLDLNKKFVLPTIRSQLRYKFNSSKFISVNYDYTNSLPSYNQLLPVENLANPLNTVFGNPNLNPNERQAITINFRNFELRSRSGLTLFLKADYFNTEIVSLTVYDANRKRNTTYENISGTYSTSLGGNWDQSIKINNHAFRYGFGLNTNYSLVKGFTNGVLYDTKSLGIAPKVYFNYEYGDLFVLMPSYNITYNESNYSNFSLNSSSNILHKMNIQITNYFPNWIIGNDFGYNYNSRIASGFKKDFYLWNTSLSYSFFNKNITAKIKVYDVLNQNQNFSRTISATSIRDEENTILKRYAMFSFTYKFQDFSAMKKK